MTTPLTSFRRLPYLAAAILATGVGLACANASRITGLGTPNIALTRDTLPGTGELTELQQHRAAWVALGINDYRFQMQATCFCGGDFIRPVLIEVRGGVVSKVWDLQTTKPIADKRLFPTITTLFDDAIAERSRGGRVRVTYNRASGIPVWLEVGTLENDAGVGYRVGGFIAI